MRPKLFLVQVETLQGNRAMEWSSTTCGQAPPERRAGSFWTWLANLTREAARTGSQFRPGGRASW